MSDNDDHRYVPAHDGPAYCTGCGWESRRIGIASTTQHDAHLEDVARKTAAPLTPDERAAEAKITRQRDRLRAREEQVRRLRAEVTRLHALVADLRTAPVTEAVRRAVTGVVANVSNWPDGAQTGLLGRDLSAPIDAITSAVLDAVREHAPVRPDREAVALTLCKEQDSTEHMEQTDDAPCSRCLAWADAVLDLWG